MSTNLTAARMVAIDPPINGNSTLAELLAAGGIGASAVATRTALKALPVSTGAALLTEAGREGWFTWQAGDYEARIPADPQEGVYLESDDEEADTGAWVRLAGFAIAGLDIRWFGAKTTEADNSTAIQACFSLSDTLGYPVAIPTGTFKFGTTLQKHQLTNIVGSGMLTARLMYTGASDAMVIEPDLALPNVQAFWKLTEFCVEHETVGAGVAGIRLLLTTAGQFISNFEIDRVFGGQFGDRSLVFDNSAGNGDGIFCGTVRRCWLYGISIVAGGDSLHIMENTIHGPGIGIIVTLVTGARQLVIRNNNITALSECVYLINVINPKIEGNWMETPSYLGNYTGTTNSLLYMQGCVQPRVIGNTIQPLASMGGGFVPADYAIRDQSGVGVLIDDNEILTGAVDHILLEGSTDTTIGWKNHSNETITITQNSTSGTVEEDRPS